MVAWLTNIAAALSQLINTLIGGHPNQTVSARCYVNKNKRGWRVAYNLINSVFFWQDNHCKSSYQADVLFSNSL